jgi:hypothetical protein
MVAVGLESLVVILLLLLIVGLLIESRISARDHLEGYDLALDEMKHSLNVVAQVLHKLPEMVPSFQINENPLTQILQFFQQRAEQQASLGAEQLRDNSGRFSHGENDKGREEESGGGSSS